MNRSVKAFSIGGVAVKLGGKAATAEQVYDCFAQFFALGSATEEAGQKETGQQDIRLELHATPLPNEAGRAVYGAKALTVTRTEIGFSLVCGASQLQVTPGSLDAYCFLAPDFGTYSPFEQREFFLLGLLMLLRPLGRYGLHACGLERQGRGLLLVGSSGSGKTTTSLNLIRQGWRYLSDDAVFLEARAESIRVSAFRRGFSCTPQTLEYFPELGGSQEFGDPDGKRVVYPEDNFGTFTQACIPSLIVFPRVTAEEVTRLYPLTSAHSLIRLCQQSAGIMTDTAVSQQQLRVLEALVGQTQSFELRLGRDALENPVLLGSLSSQVVAQTLEETLCVS